MTPVSKHTQRAVESRTVTSYPVTSYPVTRYPVTSRTFTSRTVTAAVSSTERVLVEARCVPNREVRS